ncbi:MAG: InlB B-repeat-containing protein [Oscillospiraceae bacterium]|nr:InlB B-repeat-containing protein [Oscillospiraceae bacterium]
MKKLITIFMTLCLVFFAVPANVFAAQTDKNFDFVLTVDNKVEANSAKDQIVTVTLRLKRTDSAEVYDMYGMQAELEYDDEFLQLVEGSVMTASNVEWTDMARRTGGRAFYLNYLSLSAGEKWTSDVLVGTFQMKVLGDKGLTQISNKNFGVSTSAGESFESKANDVKIIITTDCLVTFEENGGSEVEDQYVIYNEKIIEPEEPTREGYTFNGWYTDLDCTQMWNFDTDTVKENMTLYAGWLQGAVTAPVGTQPTEDDGNGGFMFPIIMLILVAILGILLFLIANRKKVHFETDGGTEIDDITVKKDEKIDKPMNPLRPGYMFSGWYKDKAATMPWDFENDKVEKNITLYAKWL